MVRIAVLGCGTMGLKIAGLFLLLIIFFSYSQLSFIGNFAYFGHVVKIFDSDLKQLDTACERIHHDEDQLYRDGLTEVPKFLVSFIYKYKTFSMFL
jgi:3-hydroxyacyl-CoA dehydrogenase